MCNIPHCCLPQESGPCLSPNVAVRPLRPATDRGLGGPLPRQLTNRTRAHPVPPWFFTQCHAAPVRLCGISSRFRLLSPGTGQAAHALLTRPPLRRRRSAPEGVSRHRSVRLACVRHAASVHPEPGSNSHVMILTRSGTLVFFS